MEPILPNRLCCRKTVLIFLSVLLFHSFAFAQTRFYLNLNTAATLTPAYNAGWNVTTGATRYAMNTTRDGSAITSKTSSSITGIATGRCLLDQWISDPLAAQTITGTFTGQIRYQLSSATSTTGQGFIYLRVINADGSIATEVGSATTTTLSATTLTNRTMIALPVGTLNITAGQRICIDLGWSYNIVAAVNRTCTISRGSAAGTDLAVDNTTTTGNNPWVQFSQTLAFLPPANDACSGATLLTSGVTCSNTAGTLIYANATAGLAACGNAASPDVWYKFVAQSAYPTITLSSVGANLTTAGPRIQLFSGTCGSLTQLTGACVASPLNTRTNPGGAGLTVGATYYVRITTTSLAAPVTLGTYTFNICITDPDPVGSAIIDYGKTYVNITDGTVGGTINPGDILEIRTTLVVKQNAAAAHRAIDSVMFFDTLRANKGFAYQGSTLALRTNEGKLYKSFTDNSADADAGWYTTAGAGTDTAIQMNMGIGATNLTGGIIRSSSRPSFYGNTCIIMATYRVAVNANYGSKINFGGGGFQYRDSVTGVFHYISFPTDSLIVYESPGACPDAVSATNVIGDEFNGTFGAPAASAGSQNRAASANTAYIYATIGANSPNDYYYGVVNNTSATNAIVQTVPKGNASRVFTVWDITGDHTGAANTARGNKPCNPALPISATNPCGYMLTINSAYKTDVAFQYNVTGACTETYYEISAWFKNLCYKCGCDSTGTGAGAGYIPTAPGDSSGVRPNIAMQIDGVDYYTTGELVYQGLGGTQTGSDTLNNWVKRSFVFKTLPGQNNFTVTFRNNAPGGGGNDWAVDDISIRTCYPNMSYSPSASPTVCAGQTLKLSDTVRSYYNVYIYYKWQRSTNGGGTWVDIAGTSGVATPVLISPNNYQFVNSYTLPPSATAPSNNGNLYRMVVATNAVNLAGTTCNYSDFVPVTLTVNNCIDIDDDNDGIPDYVESNNPVALQDANGNGVPNWNDATYPGYVDYNFDGVNDNFDYGADANNNGIPNYLDPTFPGFVDSNGDGVNDNADKDLDGIINQYDRDSDNDGIPDTVESYGVDTDGDGIIDNYTDTDADGFSQNVDANATGVAGSSNGLGAQDFDGDGIPNYLDLDSDNDGIPDVVEASGTDTNNNGKVDGFVDANFDGLSDNNFAASALLLTGPDVSPVDGRADSYPNKNLDRDFRPNAYDVDSDGDGIVDVIEAGLPDANLNGIVDGVIGTNGWSASVSSLVALNLRNTDGSGNPDYLDIDSDNDGIPDNIEGMSTAGYIRPTSLTDTDGDGLINLYDNVVGFSGSGIFVYDHDGDGIPDYRDLDTDGDGQPDIIEGNDFNLNGIADDLVTLTGLDTDGDGLDNRFDSLNSVTNIKGTSYKMGNGGSLIGDPAPGTRATVQKKTPAQIDRDWRFVGVVLPVEVLKFTGVPQNNKVLLDWTIIASKEIDHFEVERSLDNIAYANVGIVSDAVKLNEQQSFGFADDITGIRNEIIYYRLKIIGKVGEIKYSAVLVVRQSQSAMPVTIMPNPASSNVTVNLYVDKNAQVKISLVDKIGRKVLNKTENLSKGFNNITLNLETYAEGIYAMVIETPSERIVKQLVIIR
ncbi:T9SS type A sorting domain-containing protein [Ferruginibacter profundus]